MKSAQLPDDENQRVASLRDYDILDTDAEQAFDDLTALASTICNTRIALISLIDADRQWFKSKVGLDAEETPRNISFCSHAILGDSVFEVCDTQLDDRFFDNPLVKETPNIRFYAGAPLKAPDGRNIGTICVIDSKPGKLSVDQNSALTALSRQVIYLCEMRKKIVELKTETERRQATESALFEERGRFELVIRGTNDGAWDWNVKTGAVHYAPRFSGLLGYSENEFPDVFDSWESHLHPDDRGPTLDAVQHHLSDRTEYDIEYRLRCKSREYRWFRDKGKAVWNDQGQAIRMAGSISDITELRTNRNRLRAERDYSRNIITGTPTAIVGVTPDGITTFVNPAAERLTAYPAKDIVGKKWCESMFPDAPIKKLERLFNNLASGEAKDRELTLLNRHGEHRTAILPSGKRAKLDKSRLSPN